MQAANDKTQTGDRYREIDTIGVLNVEREANLPAQTFIDGELYAKYVLPQNLNVTSVTASGTVTAATVDADDVDATTVNADTVNAITIPGYATIADATYTAGANITINGSKAISAAVPIVTNYVAGSNITITGNTFSRTVACPGTFTNVTASSTVASSVITASSTAATTNSTTGAIRAVGGISTQNNMFAQGSITAADIIVAGSSAPATSSTTGAIQTFGGISSRQAIYAASGFKSTSGVFTMSTTPASLYNIGSTQHGFITVKSVVGNGSAMAFFEWTSGQTAASVTLLTQAGSIAYTFTLSTTTIQVASASGGPDAAATFFVTLL